MKIALLGSNARKIKEVYIEETLARIACRGEVSQRIGKDNLEGNAAFLRECTVAFSTWGMPSFSEEEIKKYMPNLKVLFYSAGSVQAFARPFLNCGVRVFSAYAANAVPVAEYTFSQIVLGATGFFQGSKRYKISPVSALSHAKKCTGNYRIKVGLIGLGAIGSLVAERLKTIDAEVLAYDPFVSEEKAAALGVKLADLETVFRECEVVSNHLANKKELKNLLSGKYFSLMKKHSVFINTGRGAQVDEWALAKNLILHPSRTAVLDVLKHETVPYISPLFWCPNAVITPHIAGSTGNEVWRMADYMAEQFEKYLNGEETQYEVTAQMLETMA